jgi:sialidase-1
MTEENEAEGWLLDSNWTPADMMPTRDGYVKVPMLTGTEPGKILEMKFTGTAAGIAIASGPDAGIIDFSIDDGEWKSLDLFTRWSASLHLPWFLTLADDLNPGIHILRLKLSNDKNPASKGKACRIRYFYVNSL